MTSRSERVLKPALLLFAIALPWSIAVAQIALTFAILSWLVAPGQRVPMAARSATLAAVAFAAITLLSATLSAEPIGALWDSKHLVQLCLLALVPRALRLDPDLRRAVPRLLLGSGAASATFGIVRFVLDGGGLEHRARGPFGHYMAFAGVLMLVVLIAVAGLLASGSARRWRLAFATALLTSALGASYVRSSWLGLLAGVSVMAVLRRPRALVAVALTALVAVAVAPASMRQRALSIFDLGANQDRVEMATIGVRMLRDHPLVGVGPANLPRAYLGYGPSRPQPHLHNNLLQLAVERGVPGLAAWLTLLYTLAVAAVRTRRTAPLDGTPLMALGALAALLVAGMFEYNFGDSEVAMTFLLLTSLAIEPPPRPETP